MAFVIYSFQISASFATTSGRHMTLFYTPAGDLMNLMQFTIGDAAAPFSPSCDSDGRTKSVSSVYTLMFIMCTCIAFNANVWIALHLRKGPEEPELPGHRNTKVHRCFAVGRRLWQRYTFTLANATYGLSAYLGTHFCHAILRQGCSRSWWTSLSSTSLFCTPVSMAACVLLVLHFCVPNFCRCGLRMLSVEDERAIPLVYADGEVLHHAVGLFSISACLLTQLFSACGIYFIALTLEASSRRSVSSLASPAACSFSSVTAMNPWRPQKSGRGLPECIVQV